MTTWLYWWHGANICLHSGLQWAVGSDSKELPDSKIQYLPNTQNTSIALTHNAPVPYRKMHHFVREMCTFVHISVTKRCIMGCLLMHCGMCILTSHTWREYFQDKDSEIKSYNILHLKNLALHVQNSTLSHTFQWKQNSGTRRGTPKPRDLCWFICFIINGISIHVLYRK